MKRPHPEAIEPHHRQNFSTLCRAFENGDHALVSARRVADGKKVALIAAIGRDHDDSVTITPFAEMIDDNPFERYVIPE